MLPPHNTTRQIGFLECFKVRWQKSLQNKIDKRVIMEENGRAISSKERGDKNENSKESIGTSVKRNP